MAVEGLLRGLTALAALGSALRTVSDQFRHDLHALLPVDLGRSLAQVLLFFHCATALASLFLFPGVLLAACLLTSFLVCLLLRLVGAALGMHGWGDIGRSSGEWGFALLFLVGPLSDTVPLSLVVQSAVAMAIVALLLLATLRAMSDSPLSHVS